MMAEQFKNNFQLYSCTRCLSVNFACLNASTVHSGKNVILINQPVKLIPKR